MKAVVTGVNGFVGPYLVERLLACGDEPFGLVARDPLPLSLPNGAMFAGPLLAWDLSQSSEEPPAETRRELEKFAPECIYHLAALSVPEDCGRESPTSLAWQVNVLGTQRVLRLAADLPSRPRVLFVSSSHVYRPMSGGSPVVREDSPIGPAGGYGQTKWAAEQSVDAAVAAGLDAVIVRAFQHAGPRQGPRMMLAEWAAQFAAGARPVRVHNRRAVIDLSDVRDVVRGYRLLMERGVRGERYNLGSGLARRAGDVLDLLRTLADPAREIEEMRPGPKQDPIADVARLAAATCWRPEIPLERTVADTWNWWREQAARQELEIPPRLRETKP